MKRHPAAGVLSTSLSELDQKPQDSGAVVDETDVKDTFEHEMEELEKEEDSLEIDLDDAEEGDDSVENKFNDDEDGKDQSRRDTTEDFKEKIEAMIEKVILNFWTFLYIYEGGFLVKIKISHVV